MIAGPQTIGDACSGRENNFDFLRFLLASVVIFAHSYAFLYTGLMQHDPLVRHTNGQVGLGGLAVDCFFQISGFLITRSWLQSDGLRDYVKKRALRIFPALIVVLLFCMFVVGPLGTTLPLGTYLRSAATYRYFGFMLHPSLHVYDKLPGLFLNNPHAQRVNGSLWTVRQELVCYAVVAVLGLVGAYRRPALLLAVSVAPYLLSLRGGAVLGIGGGGEFFHLLTHFMVGMLAYLYRDRVPYSRGLLLISIMLLIVCGMAGKVALVLPFCAGYLLFYIAFSKRIRLQHFARHGDLSYGVYLYAYPIQQLLVTFFRPALNVFTLTSAALAISAALAALSWRFVESPFLRLKSRPRGAGPGSFGVVLRTPPAFDSEATGKLERR